MTENVRWFKNNSNKNTDMVYGVKLEINWPNEILSHSWEYFYNETKALLPVFLELRPERKNVIFYTSNKNLSYKTLDEPKIKIKRY